MSEEEAATLPDVYCPVCDRPYKQEDHNNQAYEYMVAHVEIQHPEYTNIEEWDV